MKFNEFSKYRECFLGKKFSILQSKILITKVHFNKDPFVALNGLQFNLQNFSFVKLFQTKVFGSHLKTAINEKVVRPLNIDDRKPFSSCIKNFPSVSPTHVTIKIKKKKKRNVTYKRKIIQNTYFPFTVFCTSYSSPEKRINFHTHRQTLFSWNFSVTLQIQYISQSSTARGFLPLLSYFL